MSPGYDARRGAAFFRFTFPAAGEEAEAEKMLIQSGKIQPIPVLVRFDIHPFVMDPRLTRAYRIDHHGGALIQGAGVCAFDQGEHAICTIELRKNP